MEKNIREAFCNYLDAKMEEITLNEQQLLTEERKDEASHEKIKSNIYQIFKTIYFSLEKNPTRTQAEIKEQFLEKLEVIPNNWKIALDKARQHQDAERILIEEIKFEIRDEIRATYMRIMED